MKLYIKQNKRPEPHITYIYNSLFLYFISCRANKHLADSYREPRDSINGERRSTLPGPLSTNLESAHGTIINAHPVPITLRASEVTSTPEINPTCMVVVHPPPTVMHRLSQAQTCQCMHASLIMNNAEFDNQAIGKT